MNVRAQLASTIEDLGPDMLDLSRRVHASPELAFAERHLRLCSRLTIGVLYGTERILSSTATAFPAKSSSPKSAAIGLTPPASSQVKPTGAPLNVQSSPKAAWMVATRE